METIAFIPMREGSKGIPNKNIKQLKGICLYQYLINAIIDSKTIDYIIVATDSNDYVNDIKLKYNGYVDAYMRNPANAQDDSSSEDVMLEYIHQASIPDDNLFLLCQVTNPMIQSKDVIGLVDLIKNKGFDTALTGVDVSDRFIWNTYDNFGIYQSKSINYNYQSRPRRQDIDNSGKYYIENGGIYGSSVGRIKKYKNRLSGKIGIWSMDKRSIFEIDEQEDWDIIERLI